MRRFTGLCLLAALLAGCAPKMIPLPATATDDHRRRAEACHAVALKAAVETPGPLASWRPGAITEIGLAVGALALVSAPIWYPILKSQREQKAYDAAFDRCIVHGPAAVATMGNTTCYQELAGPSGEAFCPRDITGFELLESDSHWAVRR